MRQAKQVVKEMMIGLVIWTVITLVVLLILANHPIAVLCGELLGSIVAAGIILHMYHHIDIALSLDENGARRHTQFAAVQRLLIMAFALSCSFYFWRYINPIGMVVGIFGVKISALMYPFVHKQIEKRKK